MSRDVTPSAPLDPETGRGQLSQPQSATDFVSRPCADAFAWYREKAPECGPIRPGDIDPLALRSFLPHVMLVDVLRADQAPQAPAEGDGEATEAAGEVPLGFRFALVGGHVAAHYDEPLKGRTLDDLDLNRWRPYWQEAYGWPVRRRTAVTDRIAVAWRKRDHVILEYLFVPVAEPGGPVTRVFVVAEFALRPIGAD